MDTNEVDPFTFWKKMTLKKVFHFVMEIKSYLQVFKLLDRANKLASKNWTMGYDHKNPFTIGLYKDLKVNESSDCSICLNEFSDHSHIVNTSCKHSFCNECFRKLLVHSNKCPNCRKEIN